MKIRQATTTDIPAIIELSDQLGYPASRAQISSRLAEILERPEHAVWIAEAETGAAVGWAHVTRMVWLEMDPHAEIGGLVVDADFRAHGIGSALLERAEAWALENGLSSLRVHSNVIRDRAHHFYEKAGYRIIKSQHVFEKLLHNRKNLGEK